MMIIIIIIIIIMIIISQLKNLRKTDDFVLLHTFKPLNPKVNCSQYAVCSQNA